MNACQECIQRQRLGGLIWQIIADHPYRVGTCDLVRQLKQPQALVEDILDDLHIAGNIYRKRQTRRWHAEMSPDS